MKTILSLWIVGMFLLVGCQRSSKRYQSDEGLIFGTIYHVTYESDRALGHVISAALQEVDHVANPFDSTSMIYAVNNNLSDRVDTLFEQIYRIAEKVYGLSGGAYDVTVAPLVNAWGFGFEDPLQSPTKAQIDSLRTQVGMHLVKIRDGEVLKSHPNVKIDFASVAKGYASDHVAAALRSQGVENYLVEIGGEIAFQGVNPEHKPWRVGINKPAPSASQGDIEQVVTLPTRGGMATSGNYRNYRIAADGSRYAHTISLQTGYPIQTDILSATVLAPTSAEADALATAFMALGYDGSQTMREHLSPEISYLLILAGLDSTSYRIVASDSFPQ